MVSFLTTNFIIFYSKGNRQINKFWKAKHLKIYSVTGYCKVFDIFQLHTDTCKKWAEKYTSFFPLSVKLFILSCMNDLINKTLLQVIQGKLLIQLPFSHFSSAYNTLSFNQSHQLNSHALSFLLFLYNVFKFYFENFYLVIKLSQILLLNQNVLP